MIFLNIMASILVIVIGLIAKLVLDKRQSEKRITLPEFAIAALVMLLVLNPLIAWGGTKLAFNNAVTYNENWGGYEVAAEREVTVCRQDGICRHKYDCDPYTVTVVDRAAYTDEKGRFHPEQSHTETRYHECPYTTEEWTFRVRTTVGDYLVASHNLPTSPNAHRWRASKHVPEHIPSGVPQHWAQVKDRLDRNQPGPVTMRHEYKNYILGSQYTILKKYSPDIERYKAAGLLPDINSQFYDHTQSDRFYFVGTAPSGDWKRYSNRFAAAFGAELQGDLHLVIVDVNKVNDPDTYTAALAAYWQSAQFKRDALSKNAVVIVLGTRDGATVSWARGATGMPRGNEGLLIEIRDKLVGTKITPEALYGAPVGELYRDEESGDRRVRVTHSQGALEQILWGPRKFERVEMADYVYLTREIKPSTGQQALILLACLFAGCIAWGICIFVGAPVMRRGLNTGNHNK